MKTKCLPKAHATGGVGFECFDCGGQDCGTPPPTHAPTSCPREGLWCPREEYDDMLD